MSAPIPMNKSLILIVEQAHLDGEEQRIRLNMDECQDVPQTVLTWCQ